MNPTRKKLIPTGQPHERQHPLDAGGVKITTFIPLQFKKRGYKKVVVGPEGIDDPVVINAPEPAISPSQDPTLLMALGRGVTGSICWIPVPRRMRQRLPRGKDSTR